MTLKYNFDFILNVLTKYNLIKNMHKYINTLTAQRNQFPIRFPQVSSLKLYVKIDIHIHIHYLALGRPLLMNRFDYFSNFYEYKP